MCAWQGKHNIPFAQCIRQKLSLSLNKTMNVSLVILFDYCYKIMSINHKISVFFKPAFVIKEFRCKTAIWVYSSRYTFKINSLQNDKILERSNFKTFDSKFENCSGKGRKHSRKRRKCWLPLFSLFPTMFSKQFFYRDVKS